MIDRLAVQIEPWSKHDLPLLMRLMGDPEMMTHLGGPETPEQIESRHRRYVDLPSTGTGVMFRIVDVASGESAGSVGYWEKLWEGKSVYETGWSVLPEFQGRGFAVQATARLIELVRTEQRHRYFHAFPSVENPASNAICRKLGFTLIEERQFEYPAGTFVRCNNWRLDLITP